MSRPLIRTPTLLRSALLISVISAFIISLVIVVLKIVLEDLGFMVSFSVVLIWILFLGVAISMAMLVLFTSRDMVWN